MVETGEGDPENLIRVEVELWLGLEEDLGEVFQRISPVRSRAMFQLTPGTSVGELFSSLARKIPWVCQRVFNAEMGKFSPEVVVIKNDAVASGSTLSEEGLSHGDRILNVPVYPGGRGEWRAYVVSFEDLMGSRARARIWHRIRPIFPRGGVLAFF